jgi:hypothetical protein
MANTIVQPQVEAIADEKTLMITAHDIENTLAQSWVEAAGTFTTGALRQLGMTIGGIDARNVTAVNAQLGYTLVPLPMMPTRAALDPKARLTN